MSAAILEINPEFPEPRKVQRALEVLEPGGGMLGLIINSLKLTSSSNYRTIAVQQSYSIAETVRDKANLFAKVQNPGGSAIAKCFEATGCSLDEMYATEFAMWTSRLAAVLPAGSGTVCSDATPTDGDPSNWQCDPFAVNPAGPFVVKVFAGSKARLGRSRPLWMAAKHQPGNASGPACETHNQSAQADPAARRHPRRTDDRTC